MIDGGKKNQINDGTGFANVQTLEGSLRNKSAVASMQQIEGGLRGSINAPATGATQILPNALATLESWFKSDTGVTLNGGTVSSWANEGDPDDHPAITQSTSAQQPTFTAGVLNGFGSLDFVGASSTFLSANNALIGTDSFTFIFVVKKTLGTDGVQGALRIAQAGHTRWLMGIGTGVAQEGCGWYGSGGEFDFPISSPTTGTWVIRSYVKSSTGWNAYQNGVQIYTNLADTSASTGLSAICLGGENGSYGFTGSVTELIIYSSALSDSDRQGVEAYLNARYAIY